VKQSEIVERGVYIAKVNERITEVRVDKINTSGDRVSYSVTNLRTNRRIVFHSAQKFRSAVNVKPKLYEGASPKVPVTITSAPVAIEERKDAGDEHRPDPTPSTPSTPRESASTATNAEPSSSDPKATAPAAAPSIPEIPQPAPESQSLSSLSSASTEPSKPTSPVSGLASRLKSLDGGDSAPHLIVEARAGTGKTTTLVEGLKRLKGINSPIVPSPQQKAVWDSLLLSANGKPFAGSACFVAFNKGIATELQSRVPPGCDAMTMHSMGMKAVNAAFNRLKVESYRTSDLISSHYRRDIRELRRDARMVGVIRATENLVSLCKMNLCNGDADELDLLARHYDVELNGSREEIFQLVPVILSLAKDPKNDGCIDFDDMIWLPVVLGLPVRKYDLLLVDEAQDLNRCQQALAKKAGKRLVLCGDPKQAIYGFAGADAESMPRMAAELSATPRGCVTLPLTVTRRCGKAIVEEAKKIVSDFDAFETNPEGKISTAKYPAKEVVEETYEKLVQDGDFLLCRVNAPLVSQCFRFLRAGRKANIQGRDVGQGLITTIKKLKATSVPDLVAKVTDWMYAETSKEHSKRNPSEPRLIAIQDRADCLIAFTDGADSVEAVIRKVESVFTDDKNVVGIRLSSIHKAKGLEARRVFLLQPKGGECPHPMAKTPWQKEQEYNLLYVAITRAIEELTYVS